MLTTEQLHTYLSCTIRLFILLGICCLLIVGCRKSVEPIPEKNKELPRKTKTQKYDPEKVAASVEAFCGDCHCVPPATSFDKLSWQEQVESGFSFYVESGRSDLTMPLPIHAVEYFASKAPEKLEIPAVPREAQQLAEEFRQDNIELSRNRSISTGHVKWLKLPGAEKSVVVFTDIQHGDLGIVDIQSKQESLIANLGHPAQFQQVDFDEDGHQDFLVADLGSFKPSDHHLGRVVWLRWNPGTKKFEERVLQSNLGRVAGIQHADFDHDGDLDLVVAEFGWRSTGSVFVLENISSDKPFSTKSEANTFDDHASFVKHKVDLHHGAISSPVTDLNGDGKLDFIVLFSQEHEEIAYYENQGDFKFKRRLIYSANDPAFGSSGIALADLDQDGDQDVLFSNGDAFDTFLAKPYHGVRWLENKGDGQFTVHELAQLPGAHSAQAVDVDADGDLDIVAMALLPSTLKSKQDQAGYSAAILLRNDGKQNFKRELLQKDGVIDHPAFAIADLDEDGDPDLVSGNYHDKSGSARVTLWWNEKK